jgi:hypothetical protein
MMIEEIEKENEEYRNKNIQLLSELEAVKV